MAEIDELLAGMDGEEEEVTPTETPQIKQIREWGKAQEKKAKAYEKELAELREFRDKSLTEARTGALTAAGLTEKQAELYGKVFEEVSPENISAFKSEYLGVAPPPVEEPVEEPAPEGFGPISVGATPPVKTYTSAELQELYRQNPGEAHRLIQQGRVQHGTDQDWGRGNF